VLQDPTCQGRGVEGAETHRRHDGGCRKRQQEGAREQGGEEEAAVKTYTWASPGATALRKQRAFCSQSRDADARWVQAPSLAVSQAAGSPWDSLKRRL